MFRIWVLHIAQKKKINPTTSRAPLRNLVIFYGFSYHNSRTNALGKIVMQVELWENKNISPVPSGMKLPVTTSLNLVASQH
jgi:hypothetical protein